MLDLKKMLTKISKQMKEEFVYQDYSCPAVSITAGSIFKAFSHRRKAVAAC